MYNQLNYRNILLGITFVDLLGFGLLLPIMPFIALECRATPIQISVLASIFPLFQIFFSPILGKLSDLTDSKKILSLSLIGNSISFLIFAMSHDFKYLIASRALAGVFSASLGIVRGELTNISDYSETQKNFQLFGAFQGIGVLAGPIIGSVLIPISNRLPIFLASLFSLLMAIFVFFSKKQQANKQKFDFEFLKIFRSCRDLSKNRYLVSIFAVFFFLYMSFSLLFISLPLFIFKNYSFKSFESSIYFALLALFGGIGQTLALTKLKLLFSSSNILLFNSLLLSTIFYFLSLPISGVYTGVCIIIFSLLLFTCFPILSTEIGVNSRQEEKNFTSSITESVSGFARLLGIMLSGYIIERSHITVVFYMSSMCAFFSFLLIFFNKNKIFDKNRNA
ncbi:MAG: MFS transporter [Deltaproteobacteria bacterium]|nr:MFS transporter [Deltaproteobacteria bacterium]